ncbi:MAG TPA: methyltransferase domain-containing protein [Polyangiaceae bacterium]|nr:methyltransferase domain-containing protein [Polyangiaceae bacterium]
MKWYVKALVQNGMALLPEPVAQPLYYRLQRHLGELRRPRFDLRLKAALHTVELLRDHHDGIEGKRILEVGTGRTVDVPMALWLMGAAETVTVDITRLLRPELVGESYEHLHRNWRELRPRFVALADERLVDERFAALGRAVGGGVRPEELEDVLGVMNVVYLAPADATSLDLPDESFDVMTTFVVLQHLPPEPMRAILRAGRRLLQKSGAMVHTANTGDHFAHVDASLSPLHFLRWSEWQWDLIAGNRYMYQNRMRADDYYALFEACGLRVVHTREQTDERALRELRDGLPLHPDWQGRSPERDAVIRFEALLERDDARRS